MKILYFSSVAYGWMKQRPQFVAENLSKEYEIHYLTCTPLGKAKETDAKDAPFKTSDVSVLPFALKSGLVRFFNRLYLNAKINFKEYDLVVITHPVQFGYVPKNIPIIYECMDLMEGFYEGKAKKSITILEKRLLKCAKAVIASSDALKNKLIQKGAHDKKITVIKNAVDKDWVYEKDTVILLKPQNLVYIGTVSSWFDIETLVKFCNLRPEKTVYVVGKNDIEIKDIPKNLIFTGKIEHNDVKGYIKSADILLMPFNVNELIKCVDPVKMYEYLSFNKHVVSTYWEELEPYKSNPFVHFYDSTEKFISLCDIIPKTEQSINKKFVEDNCWQSRMKQYFKIIKEIL